MASIKSEHEPDAHEPENINGLTRAELLLRKSIILTLTAHPEYQTRDFLYFVFKKTQTIDALEPAQRPKGISDFVGHLDRLNSDLTHPHNG